MARVLAFHLLDTWQLIRGLLPVASKPTKKMVSCFTRLLKTVKAYLVGLH